MTQGNLGSRASGFSH
ncbi:Protein of unknown function [Cotesia congregata]|uniref:Uncharacterized protein n=1 Tax=Cotesia congregata TaxID=51543 RepID=A0A8J2HBS6_COTCN|nr:Protein of unknown function [Cotesia congregata]